MIIAAQKFLKRAKISIIEDFGCIKKTIKAQDIKEELWSTSLILEVQQRLN